MAFEKMRRYVPYLSAKSSKPMHLESRKHGGCYFLNKLFAVYHLTRFEHAIMFALSVFVAEIIASKGIPQVTPPIIFSLLVPVFSEMGAFAMNDLLDVETDRINKKKRPLVIGELSEHSALIITVISFALALIFAFLVSWPIFFLTAVLIFLAAFYNFILKDLPIVGNAYIAFTMGIPFIFGNLVISSVFHITNILIAILGFTTGLGREIAKSVEDVEGDREARKSNTLPVLIGVDKALMLAGMLYIISVFASLTPYYFQLKIGIGFAIVLLADLTFTYIALMFLFSRYKTSFLKIATKLSLFALFLGLAGILISVLGY